MMISTDVMILVTIWHAARGTRHAAPATRLLVPGPCNLASLWIKHPGAYMEAYSQVRLGVYFRVCSGVCLRAS